MDWAPTRSRPQENGCDWPQPSIEAPHLLGLKWSLMLLWCPSSCQESWRKKSNWNLAEAMGSNEKNRSTSYNIGKPNWNHLKHLPTLLWIALPLSPSWASPGIGTAIAHSVPWTNIILAKQQRLQAIVLEHHQPVLHKNGTSQINMHNMTIW